MYGLTASRNGFKLMIWTEIHQMNPSHYVQIHYYWVQLRNWQVDVLVSPGVQEDMKLFFFFIISKVEKEIKKQKTKHILLLYQRR